MESIFPRDEELICTDALTRGCHLPATKRKLEKKNRKSSRKQLLDPNSDFDRLFVSCWGKRGCPLASRDTEQGAESAPTRLHARNTRVRWTPGQSTSFVVAHRMTERSKPEHSAGKNWLPSQFSLIERVSRQQKDGKGHYREGWGEIPQIGLRKQLLMYHLPQLLTPTSWQDSTAAKTTSLLHSSLSLSWEQAL